MTSADRYQQVAAIFLAVCDRPLEARAAALDDACGDDDQLRGEVEAMLARDGEKHAIDEPALGTSIAQSMKDLADPPTSETEILDARTHPDRIGQYTILGVLGEGGMGSVYRAEQRLPQRTVALKVIHAGVASRRLLQRFRHEAEMLGRLNHPGIAQIYEAGTFDSGSGTQPYFAMELVIGDVITDHADDRQLGLAGRVELLVGVCDAVHHAHQKGIVHRDLKPANILVDQAGQPKVLDFGVARATDADLQTTTLQTNAGQLLGTVPYMSPEQIAGRSEELDTRSDVYALGVLAYRLLSGKLPHDLIERSIPDAARIIETEEPVPLGHVRRECRGDLEAVVGKALRKAREDRYQSASDLAADFGRALRAEPVTARSPTLRYRLRTLARRRRVSLSAIVIASVVFLAGVITLGIAYADASAGRALAEARRLEAERVDGLLFDLFRADGSPLTLDEAEQRIIGLDGWDGEDAGEAASLRRALGRALVMLGEPARAEPYLRKALQQRSEALGEDHPVTLLVTVDLAEALLDAGSPAGARELLEDAVTRGTARLGDDDPIVVRGREVLERARP